MGVSRSRTRLGLALLGLSLVHGGGCGCATAPEPAPEPVAQVQPTPSEPEVEAPSEEAEAEAEAKATPWTAPEPTILPGLDGAAQLLALGRTDETLERLAEGSAPDEGADEWFRHAAILGRARRLSGDPEGAVGALEPLLAQRRLADHLPPELVALELAQARLAWAEALDGDEAREQRRKAATELGKQIRRRPNHHVAPIRVLQARALGSIDFTDDRSGRKEAGRAVRTLGAVIEAYPQHPDLADLQLLQARAMLASGRPQDAALALRQIVVERGEDPVVSEARRMLVAVGGPDEADGDDAEDGPLRLTRRERLDQAASARALRHTELSLQVLDELLAEDDLPSHQRREALYSRAWSRYKAAQYDGCAEDMRVLIERTPSVEYRKHLTRCLRYGGRYAEASQTWLEAAQATKSPGLGAEYRWKAVKLSADGGLYARALELLADYDDRGYSAHGEDRRWLRAWLPYRLGDFETAIEKFEEVERRGDDRKNAARYFRGKLMMATGDPAGADLLREVVEDGWKSFTSHGVYGGFPDYYGLMARERLQEAGEAVPEPPELGPMPDVDEWRDYGDARAAFDELRPAMADKATAFQRADQLHAVGWLDESRREFRVLARGFVDAMSGSGGGNTRNEEFDVGVTWEEEWSAPRPRLAGGLRHGLRRNETRDAWRLQLRELAFALDEPYYVARLTLREDAPYRARYYLRAYRDVVERVAIERDIDPLHYWSLMYTESRFRRHVVSYVGARGAMQIYPPSWRKTLRKRGEYDGRLDVDRLFDIETNLRASGTATKEVFDHFHGQRALVYGSYNGGKGNVSRWLQAKAGEDGTMPLDDFVEEIVFDETRKYVRRVLAVHAGYHLMYRGELPEFDHVVRAPE